MQPFHFEKGVDYYIRVFISASLALLIYGLIEVLWRDAPFWTSVMEFWYLPFFVTLLLWFYNSVSDKFFSGMDARNEEREFIYKVSRAVKDELGYDREDFRQLRNDEKFQRLIEDAYKVFENGESDALNYEHLLKRFEDDPENLRPAEIVVDKTKRLREKYKAPHK